jgi:hypothetical protein
MIKWRAAGNEEERGTFYFGEQSGGITATWVRLRGGTLLNKRHKIHKIRCTFQCPHTGEYAMVWVPNIAADERGFAEAVTWTVCGNLHFVDPKTGRVLASGDHQPAEESK